MAHIKINRESVFSIELWKDGGEKAEFTWHPLEATQIADQIQKAFNTLVMEERESFSDEPSLPHPPDPELEALLDEEECIQFHAREHERPWKIPCPQLAKGGCKEHTKHIGSWHGYQDQWVCDSCDFKSETPFDEEPKAATQEELRENFLAGMDPDHPIAILLRLAASEPQVNKEYPCN